MTSIKDLFNKISDFKCTVDGKEVIFPGILQEENGNIILNAKFPMEQYRIIVQKTDILILGKVFGREITLFGCYIKSGAYITIGMPLNCIL